MANCLVTGGSGFIGSHIVDRLIDMGHYVINIDNESAESNREFYKNLSADNYKLDVTNYKSIEPLFHGVDYVFHLASDARIQIAVKNPLQSLNINCRGTLNVLEASKKHNVKRLVFSSSSSIYGQKGVADNKESAISEPMTIYGISKQFAENLLRMYPELDPVALRYFNVYGERQPVDGEYAPVIGLFLQQKANGEPLTIVGDGLQTRDFTYVQDVVDATLMAAFSDRKMNAGIYNVGTGKNYSILEIAQMLSSKLKFLPERVGEVEQTLADNTKIFNDLGWSPKTNLKEWLKNQ